MGVVNATGGIGVLGIGDRQGSYAMSFLTT